MSIVEYTTTITPATVRNMKRSKLEEYLLLFANKSVSDDAEITRLKAELYLRTREREPIEFEFIPSLEMVKDSWLGELIPMEAVGKKFRCVEILEEGK